MRALTHRRLCLMLRMLAVGGLAVAVLTACTARQAPAAIIPEPPAEDPGPTAGELAAVEMLYGQLFEASRQYRRGIELIVARQEALGEAQLAAAATWLHAGAGECTENPGCDLERFLHTFDLLLDEQSIALKQQLSHIEDLERTLAEDIEREPGTSPFVAEMPEIGETVSMLKGTDLRDIITLNGPVNAALDDWLTWMRPLLLDAFENYQFLRDEIAPLYDEAGLPEALLFAILATETGGKVHSHSRAGAAGPLQFMHHTARRYGLRVEDGFDMRLDPVAATKANIAYLNDQFEEFNNSLEKALAAYNGGETRVRKLHRRLKGVSLWDSRMYYSLPRETREYVPRILAAAWLFLHADDYNLEFPTFDTEKTRLTVEEDIALGELTICLGQVYNPNGWFRTLRNLNPRLSPGERVEAGQEITIPAVLVPVYHERCVGGDLLARAHELHDANYPDGSAMFPYIVQRGDTLGKIAARHRCVSIRELADINRIRRPKYVIHVGQQLTIPACP